MRWTVGTKIGLGFALALAILVSVGSISYNGTNKLISTTDWVTHTHKVLEELDALLQALTDAETGQRGYIITAEEAYLEPYHASAGIVEQYVKDLRDLTKDNPHQQQRLDILQALAEKRLVSLKEVLDLQKSKGQDAAKQWILTGGGKKEMDDIRKVIADMKEEENVLLRERSDQAQAAARSTKLTILVGTVSALLVVALAGFAISRNIAKPLKQITTTAERIAAGDLGVSVIKNHRRDEVGVLAETFGRMTQSLREMANVAEGIANGDLRVKVRPQSDKDLLGNAFASMVENLRRLTAQMTEGVNVLSSSASQISTSTTQLSSGAAETAAAISQTTTTVEEVRQTAQLSSQKAKLVSETAQRTAQNVQTQVPPSLQAEPQWTLRSE